MEICNVAYRDLAAVSIACSINPTIIHLILKNSSFSSSMALELLNLKLLEVHSGVFVDKDFWVLCARLERLIIDRNTLPKLPTDVTFPDLTHLEIGEFVGQDLNLVEFASRCRNLRVIRLPVGTGSKHLMAGEFGRLAMAGTWPRLRSLRFSPLDIPDAAVEGILGSMQPHLEWKVGKSGFGPQSFKTLRNHFRTILHLDLKQCQNVTSEMIQEVLSSCPQLVVFRGDRIEARHIVDGKPWVCSSLKELTVNIDFDFGLASTTTTQGTPVAVDAETTEATTAIDSTKESAKPLENNGMDQVQRRVFKQLSVLHDIRTLNVGFEDNVESGVGAEGNSALHLGLDLRLRMGLDQLHCLKKITTLSFQGTLQTICVEDISWILVHWKSLESASGTFDSVDSQRNVQLIEILQKHGVRV
ncbi:hypothetical protein BGZ65_010305 [Modicella reniformis]|uniref:Uncharacterized protein n=1 Tax=Modicella reniformis TaxID=1440133 RepID=A0A9P6LSV5_9FUNG|nr:hypothetical protein BGZ65_010305 [Modicella reniformis]